MSTLFISDLHLDASQAARVDGFIDWLDRQAGRNHHIYILGDLFEAWIGDDDDAPPGPAVRAALARCNRAGTAVSLMHGNRDFLISEAFLADSACRLLPDPAVVDLYGRPALLMHGDLLCSDDHDYQRIRRQVRDPHWQRDILSRPLAERRELARQARRQSRLSMLGKSRDIMDVNADTVAETVARHGVDLLIHGHTHRPAIHPPAPPERRFTRVVLGDWGDSGSLLRVTPQGGLTLETVSL